MRLARTSRPPRLEAWPLQEFSQVLPNIALVEIDREDVATARYVLFGRRLRDLLGRDPAGKLISEVYPPAIAAEVLETFQRVVQSGQPETSRRDFKILTWNFGYHRWVGPFGIGQEVTHLMVALFPVQPALRLAAQWKAAVSRWRAHNAIPSAQQDQEAWAQVLQSERQAQHELWYV